MGRLHICIDVFDKRKSLKAHIHEMKIICVELNVRLYVQQQMNTISENLYTPKMRLTQLETDVSSSVNRVTGIEIFVQKHCICPK